MERHKKKVWIWAVGVIVIPIVLVVGAVESSISISGEMRWKRVALLVAEGVNDFEVVYPKMRFEAVGAVVDLVALTPGAKTSSHGLISLDFSSPPDSASMLAYDALILPDGTGRLASDTTLRWWVKKLLSKQRVVAAMGDGVSIMAHAGVLQGVHATGPRRVHDDLEIGGASIQEAPVVVSANRITSTAVADLVWLVPAVIDRLKQVSGG